MQPFASRFSKNQRCHDLGSFRFVGPRPPRDVWDVRLSRNRDVLARPSCGWSGYYTSSVRSYFKWHMCISHGMSMILLVLYVCLKRNGHVGFHACPRQIVHIASYMWPLWPDLTRLLESKTFTKQLRCCGLLTWPQSFAGDIWLQAIASADPCHPVFLIWNSTYLI